MKKIKVHLNSQTKVMTNFGFETYEGIIKEYDYSLFDHSFTSGDYIVYERNQPCGRVLIVPMTSLSYAEVIEE